MKEDSDDHKKRLTLSNWSSTIRDLDSMADWLEADLEHSDNEVRQRIAVVVEHLVDASRILSETRQDIERKLEWQEMRLGR